MLELSSVAYRYKKNCLWDKQVNKVKNSTPIDISETTLAFNLSNAELNPICHLLALLGAHLIFHVSELRVKYVSVVSEPINTIYTI